MGPDHRAGSCPRAVAGGGESGRVSDPTATVRAPETGPAGARGSTLSRSYGREEVVLPMALPFPERAGTTGGNMSKAGARVRNRIKKMELAKDGGDMVSQSHDLESPSKQRA